jgi:hypothetical protein
VRKALLLLLFPGVALAQPDLFIEAELSPARVYAGAEARLVLRVLRAPGVAPGTLRPPRLHEDAGEISLLTVRNYEETRNGVAYRVFERTNVVVPRASGRLVIPGAQFESAAYFTEQFARSALPRAVRGPEQVLEVLPAPAGAGAPFLPARDLSLEESWSRDLDALSAGEPVTRTLVLRAVGLAAERLPQLAVSGEAALRVHFDQPEYFTEYLESGMVGRRTQRIVLMPMAEGEVLLPEVRVRWWDVGADVERVAMLPARALRLNSVIAPAAVPAPAPVVVETHTVLEIVGTVFLVVGALLLWGYLRGHAVREARAKLRDACRRNDALGAKNALVEWWQAARPGEAVPVVTQMRLGDLRELDAALYAGRPWDGKALWARVKPLSLRRARRARVAPQITLFRLVGGSARPR